MAGTFRREWWEPMKQALVDESQPVLLRYYPAAILVLIAVICAWILAGL